MSENRQPALAGDGAVTLAWGMTTGANYHELQRRRLDGHIRVPQAMLPIASDPGAA
jgi:hypothetical protein